MCGTSTQRCGTEERRLKCQTCTTEQLIIYKVSRNQSKSQGLSIKKQLHQHKIQVTLYSKVALLSLPLWLDSAQCLSALENQRLCLSLSLILTPHKISNVVFCSQCHNIPALHICIFYVAAYLATYGKEPSITEWQMCRF